MRHLLALLAGSLFGTGLFLSGMTDTTKVQGWLDIFGNWDPTLAFVMGGAILPMAIAWPDPVIDRRLVCGSVLFGIGWGLAGLCPGPAVASLSYGGLGGLVFMLSMLAGMGVAPTIGARLDRIAAAA